MSRPDPLLDVAGGDAAVSRQLTHTLRLLAAHTTDPALKEQISAVLSGKAEVRDFVRAETFTRTLDQVMPAALDNYLAMSEEQRQQLAAQGEAELELYRTPSRSVPEPAIPEPAPARPAEPPTPPAETVTTRNTIAGTRKPNRDQIVTPDEPDEDDLYFQQRNQRGWLE